MRGAGRGSSSEQAERRRRPDRRHLPRLLPEGACCAPTGTPVRPGTSSAASRSATQSDQLAAPWRRRSCASCTCAETRLNPARAQLLARISLASRTGCISAASSCSKGATDDRDELVGRAYRTLRRAPLKRSRRPGLRRPAALHAALLQRARADVTASCGPLPLRLLVDEYQDTNGPQYEIVRLIRGAPQPVRRRGRRPVDLRLARRGRASRSSTSSATSRAPRSCGSRRNYRSNASPSSTLANRVIAHNPDRHEKSLRSEPRRGEPRARPGVEDEVDARPATSCARDHRRAPDAPSRASARLGDFAVLFRAGNQPRVFETELRARGIPYTLVGGPSFFDRKEVRDVLAYLQACSRTPDDEVSFLRAVGELSAARRSARVPASTRCSRTPTEHGHRRVTAAFDRRGRDPREGSGAKPRTRSETSRTR